MADPEDSTLPVSPRYALAFELKTIPTRIKETLAFVILLSLYLLVGAAVYANVEEYEDGSLWTAIDALYFTTATMSTVGYGDLSPGSEGTRAFTVVMVFVGILIIFPFIGGLVSLCFSPLTAKGRDLLERCFPAISVDIDNSGNADYTIPRAAPIYYGKNLLPSIALCVVLQLVSAGVFVALEQDWTYGDAVYHVMITATTVGYGDVSIVSQGGRLWAVFHMTLSVSLLGEIISTYGDLKEERKAVIARANQLQKRCDPDLLRKLLDRAQQVWPKHDGKGLSSAQYALISLLELEIVTDEQVIPFLTQFRKLDSGGDGDGKLSADDLRSIIPQASMQHLKNARSGKHKLAAVEPAPVGSASGISSAN